MYIPFVSEVCAAIVLATQVLFCIMAAVKVIWTEEKCYQAIRKSFKTIFMCKDTTTEKVIPVLRMFEMVGLVSWVVWFCQPKM